MAKEIPVYTLSLPEYHVATEPDHDVIGKKVDDFIKQCFLGEHVVMRCLGSIEHSGKTVDEVVEIIVGARDYTGLIRARGLLYGALGVATLPTLIGPLYFFEVGQYAKHNPEFNEKKSNRLIAKTKRSCEEQLEEMIEDEGLNRDDYYCSEVIIFETNQKKPEKKIEEKGTRGPMQVYGVTGKSYSYDYYVYTSGIMKKL